MKKAGLSTMEYAILIMVVVAAVVAMRSYIRKAICGSWRAAADTFGYGGQYEPE